MNSNKEMTLIVGRGLSGQAAGALLEHFGWIPKRDLFYFDVCSHVTLTGYPSDSCASGKNASLRSFLVIAASQLFYASWKVGSLYLQR